MEDHSILFDDSTGRGYIGFHGRLWEVQCPSVFQATLPGGILASEPSVRLISIRHRDEAELRQEGRLRLLKVLRGDVTFKAAAQLVLSEQVVRAVQQEHMRLPTLKANRSGGYGPV